MASGKDVLDTEISAGEFSAWLKQAVDSLRGKRSAAVPCGECSACCNSSLFVYIKPSDVQALKRIPKKLMIPVPGLAKGHMLMGYDETGRCQMYLDGQCSIYTHRPKTCRQYDCRILAATGLQLKDPGKVLITRQAARWRFEFPTEQDRKEYAAVRKAAEFVSTHAEKFPGGIVPASVMQQAIFTLCVYEYFLQAGAGCDDAEVMTTVAGVMDAYKKWR